MGAQNSYYPGTPCNKIILAKIFFIVFRIKDKVDNDWMADEALDEADLDAVLDNDNNDDDYQPDQEVK